MNKQHWSGYTERELAQMRGRVRASRHVPLPAREPDVTAETRLFLDRLGSTEPAYPPHWLPEIKASQTPADWMRDGNAPDPREQRNGTATADEPAPDAYPAEWLQGVGGLGGGALGGEGFLTDRRAS